jgi:hypothetical protein
VLIAESKQAGCGDQRGAKKLAGQKRNDLSDAEISGCATSQWLGLASREIEREERVEKLMRRENKRESAPEVAGL